MATHYDLYGAVALTGPIPVKGIEQSGLCVWRGELEADATAKNGTGTGNLGVLG